MPLHLPTPPHDYQRQTYNQRARTLEQEDLLIWAQIQKLILNIAPSYTTTQKNSLANMAGQVIFDTTLGKLCVNTGSGWQTITST